MLVGRGAYEFARAHGHAHTELLTDRSRRAWLRWRETMSDRDDRLPPVEQDDDRTGWVQDPDLPLEGPELAWLDPAAPDFPRHGTIHCSVLSSAGHVSCCTTTSGLAWKIPGRIGDSPIIGAGLYCDDEAGSAGATGRGEAAILSTGSAAIVEALRRGAHPKDAGLEVLERIARQTRRQRGWQPGLLDEQGNPSFNIHFYVLDKRGRFAGVTMKERGRHFAVADREGGPRRERLTALFS